MKKAPREVGLCLSQLEIELDLSMTINIVIVLLYLLCKHNFGTSLL